MASCWHVFLQDKKFFGRANRAIKKQATPMTLYNSILTKTWKHSFGVATYFLDRNLQVAMCLEKISGTLWLVVTDVMADMLVHKNKSISFPWELGSVFMKILRKKFVCLRLYCCKDLQPVLNWYWIKFRYSLKWYITTRINNHSIFCYAILCLFWSCFGTWTQTCLHVYLKPMY